MNDEFKQALDFTAESLGKLSENGSTLRGSRESLRRLATARAPLVASVPSVPLVPSPAPAAKPSPAQPSHEVFPTTGDTKQARIDQLRAAVAPCTKCPQLARTRTQ